MKSKKTLTILLAIIIVLAAAALAVRYYVFADYTGPDVRINISATTTESDVRSQMESTLGPSFGSKVYTLWKWRGGNASVSHGSYLISAADNAASAANRIAKGRQTPVRFTFNNLVTTADLAARAAAALELDSASFVAAADSILSAAGYTTPAYASAFLPDTYEFYWTVAPAKVVDTLLKHRNNFWNDERTAKAKVLGLTPAQVHTLASIVECESAMRDEYPLIARLYLNRLAASMPLQADPTVKFAIGDPTLRRITSEQLKTDSPYNTYKNRGLPPGPIRIADARTIDAVLDAPDHNYLYMCAKSDFSGYHDFAEDYGRHRINAARYHRALNARGIH